MLKRLKAQNEWHISTHHEWIPCLTSQDDHVAFLTPYIHEGFIKKHRPFNHIFGGDRIFRAWYRGIKNAGPRKRAQGRAQDIPYQSISPYHHGIWRIFIVCGKNPHARKSAQGRSARGPILPKSTRNFRQPPHPGNLSMDTGQEIKAWKKRFRFNRSYFRYPGIHIQFFGGVRWQCHVVFLTSLLLSHALEVDGKV